MDGHGDGYWHHGHGFPVLGWLVPLLVLALLAGLVIWAFVGTGARRRTVQQPTAPPAASVDTALTELRLRYARGEVSREDFLRISADLGGPVPPASPTDAP